MHRRTELMIGAAATALTAASPMLATPAAAQPIPPAATYAALFDQVPDAAARLDAADSTPRLMTVQYAPDGGQMHHHHHHHHHHSRSWYRAHGYVFQGGAWIVRPVAHHHHHHHHHSNY